MIIPVRFLYINRHNPDVPIDSLSIFDIDEYDISKESIEAGFMYPQDALQLILEHGWIAKVGPTEKDLTKKILSYGFIKPGFH